MKLCAIFLLLGSLATGLVLGSNEGKTTSLRVNHTSISQTTQSDSPLTTQPGIADDQTISPQDNHTNVTPTTEDDSQRTTRESSETYTKQQISNQVNPTVMTSIAKRTDLQVNPSTITIGGDTETERLTLSCTVTGPDITSMSLIELGKEVDGTRSKIALITLRDEKPTIVDDAFKARATTSGSIKDTQGDLVIHLSKLGCADGGKYYCVSSYNTDDSKYDEIETNVIVQANPEKLQLKVSPYESEFDVNAEIYIMCYGNVGNVFDKTKPDEMFTWETKLPNEGVWTPYSDRSSKYYSVPMINGDNPCQYHWASILTHTVLEQDKNRQIKCSVLEEMKSDIFTVKLNADPPASQVQRLTPGCTGLLVIMSIATWRSFRE